jgi:hypothetical protein
LRVEDAHLHHELEDEAIEARVEFVNADVCARKVVSVVSRIGPSQMQLLVSAVRCSLLKRRRLRELRAHLDLEHKVKAFRALLTHRVANGDAAKEVLKTRRIGPQKTDLVWMTCWREWSAHLRD